jgi:DNA-binding phage protein
MEEVAMREPRPPVTATKLARFMRANKLKAIVVASEAGVSRQHMYRIRKGIANPGIWTAVRIRDACGRLLLRIVSIDELFDACDPQAVRLRERRP